MTFRWSPGPPGSGMPAGRGDRTSLRSIRMPPDGAPLSEVSAM